MLRSQLRASMLLGHPVVERPPPANSDRDAQRWRWWCFPLPRLPRNGAVWIALNHVLLTFLCAWFVLFGSLVIAGYFGDNAAAVPPAIGLYAALVSLAHVPLLYLAFNARTWTQYDVRINPYVTLAECALHRGIGVAHCIAELVAQVLGAVAATALAYGILSKSIAFTDAVDGPPFLNDGDVWRAFGLETFGGFFLGWIYFHNWYHQDSPDMPATMAYVVAGTMALGYPFVGSSTHNPLRHLSACVIAGTCGGAGTWIYWIGPLVGVLLGYVAHLGTYRIRPPQ